MQAWNWGLTLLKAIHAAGKIPVAYCKLLTYECHLASDSALSAVKVIDYGVLLYSILSALPSAIMGAKLVLSNSEEVRLRSSLYLFSTYRYYLLGLARLLGGHISSTDSGGLSVSIRCMNHDNLLQVVSYFYSCSL